MNARFHIGISGWTYAPWRGVFYPEELPHREELDFASRQFSTIEINGTHYSLQRPESFQRWRDATPEGFIFSVKASRYITHLRRLREIEAPLANFLASGLLALREKLGPILWQFPPSFRFDAERMENFFAMLPHDTEAAAKVARRHDEWMKERAFVEVDERRPMRHCIEVRHESFMAPEFFELLRRHDIAFVFADTAGKWPYAEDLTSDFVYARLHGDEQIYVSGYTEHALQDWAARLRAWAKGHAREGTKLVTEHESRKIHDLYVYFDNDVKVKAPENARRLAKVLNAEPETIPR